MPSPDIATLNSRKNISVIIAAAGVKYGLKTGPVSLLPIKSTTLFEYQYKLLKKFLPKSDITLVGGYEFEKLRKRVPSDVILLRNDKYEETNSAYSIGLALNTTKDNDVLIIHGNIFFEQSVLQCSWNKSFLFCSNIQEDDNKRLGCTVDKTISNIMFGLPYGLLKMSFLTGNELALYKQHCYDKKNYPAYDWEILNKVINSGGKLYPNFKKQEDFLEIDISSDAKKV